jgi:hypothetical protein
MGCGEDLISYEAEARSGRGFLGVVGSSPPSRRESRGGRESRAGESPFHERVVETRHDNICIPSISFRLRITEKSLPVASETSFQVFRRGFRIQGEILTGFPRVGYRRHVS